MAIQADVAPYSREYNTYRQRIGKEAQGNTELEIEYEKILKRVKQTRESVIRMQDRHFTEPVDEISGTVEQASPGGVTLKEYPGRLFQFSSVSTSAADMSARILGENNNMTRSFHPSATKRPHARGPDRSCIHTSMIRASPSSGTPMLFEKSKLEWSLRPAEPKTTSHARQIEALSMIRPRPVLAASPCSRGLASANGCLRPLASKTPRACTLETSATCTQPARKVCRAAMSQVSGQDFEDIAGLMIGNNLLGLSLPIKVLLSA